jgi:hypothetical protein
MPAIAVDLAALLSIATAVGLILFCAGYAQRVAEPAEPSEPEPARQHVG